MDPLICIYVICLSTDVPFNNNYPEQGSLTKERVRLGEILQDKENIIQSQRLDNIVVFISSELLKRHRNHFECFISVFNTSICQNNKKSQGQGQYHVVGDMMSLTSLIISTITFVMAVVTCVLWSWSTGHPHPFVPIISLSILGKRSSN